MSSIQLTSEANCFLVNAVALQVKMFVHKDPADAEEAINQWLKKSAVSIDHITQSQSERNGSFVFIVSVFYKI